MHRHLTLISIGMSPRQHLALSGETKINNKKSGLGLRARVWSIRCGVSGLPLDKEPLHPKP